MCLMDFWLYIVCVVLFGVHTTQQQDTLTLQILGLFTFTNCQPEHEFECHVEMLS